MNWESRKKFYNKDFFTIKITAVRDDKPIRMDAVWCENAMALLEIYQSMFDVLSVLQPIPKVLQNGQNDRLQTVLDCGCSTGGIVFGLAQIVPEVEAVGFDLAEYAIDHALPEIEDKLLLLDLAIHPLPFTEGYFDFTIAFDFLEHQDAEHLPFVMSEITRVSNNILIRQPMVHFDMPLETRMEYIASLNHLTHKERLALVDCVPELKSSTPDSNCPYHPMENPRRFWVELFEAYGFAEKNLDETFYLIPNSLSLSSFTTLFLQRKTGLCLSVGLVSSPTDRSVDEYKGQNI